MSAKYIDALSINGFNGFNSDCTRASPRNERRGSKHPKIQKISAGPKVVAGSSVSVFRGESYYDFRFYFGGPKVGGRALPAPRSSPPTDLPQDFW